MLSFVMIASLEDIYYKILSLKDEIQTSNACPCPSNEVFDKLNSYLELIIKEIDENVSFKDTSSIKFYIQSNIVNLENSKSRKTKQGA